MNKIVQIPSDYNGIMVVGEAPGKEEGASLRFSEEHGCYIGKPFIGAEGRYLRNCCRAVSFPFDQCVVINTVHEVPSGNVYDSLPKHVIDEGRSELISAIRSFKPRLIVAIGNKSLEMLTGKSGITKYRGTLLSCTLVEDYKVFSTIHPGFIFKGNPQYDIVLKIDLKKALDEFNTPSVEKDRTIHVIRDKSEALKTLYDACFLKQKLVIDIETGGPKLLAFGVATSPQEAFVIPKDLLKHVCVMRAISEFCDSSAKKVYHNALYDVFYLAYYYKIFTRNISDDTMLAQHAIFPTLPKSLAFCSSLYTREPYWKDEGKEVTKDYSPNKIIDWEEFYIYNGKDCCVTYEVLVKQEEELDFWKTHETYQLMMRTLDFALVSMLRGFCIDWEKLKIFKDHNERAIAVVDKIREGLLGDINLNSSKQTIELLYDTWRLPVQKLKGRPSSADDKISYLETLPTNVQHLLGLISKTREHRKLRSFYDIAVDEDGKMRCSLKLHGTYTGRWATSKSITGSGMNMQNIPKAARVLYRSSPGKIFLQWDLSNAEARVVAALCGDERWLRSFDEEDQHTIVAASLFGIPKEDVKKKYSGDKSYRDFGKKVAHATHYLEGQNKLSLTIGCSRNEAGQHIKSYKKLRPLLEEWHHRVAKDVGKSRIIKTCFGRTIQFFGPFFEQKLPEAVAAEPQSTSADYLSFGLVECLEKLPELEFKLQVHDSGIVEVSDNIELIKTLIPKIKKIMERKVVVNGLDLIIPIEFDIGYNWGELVEVKDFDKIDGYYHGLKR